MLVTATAVAIGIVAGGVAAARSDPKQPKREAQTQEQINAIEKRRKEDEEYWILWETRHPTVPRNLPVSRRPLRLLSIDGGGVRGIISLITLDQLMKEVAPRARPCEYFDLIGGTSTGGLIAIMLGRLRMSIPECIATYTKLSRDVFDVGLLKKMENMLDAYRFPAENLEKAIKDVVAAHRGNTSTKMLDSRENKCRTFVVAIPGCNVDQPVKRFRTYNNRYQRISGDRCEIWEAARATSCAPSFFPEIKVGGVYYSDGGLGYNNPARLVLDETRSLWGPTHPISCLLSLGTGSVDSFIRRFKHLPDFLSFWTVLENLATNCNKVHHELLNDQGVRPFYYRFNPKMEKEIGLDEWKRMGDLQKVAFSYLSSNGGKVSAFVGAVGA